MQHIVIKAYFCNFKDLICFQVFLMALNFKDWIEAFSHYESCK